MKTPTFGIFDHIEGIPGTGTQQLFRDRLDLVRMADQAGFTGFYLAEHHGTDLCMAPNQDLVIAAASQITTTIRMGPMVKLLPLHHPVQLIEDLCVLDNLTAGRLAFGVGRGVDERNQRALRARVHESQNDGLLIGGGAGDGRDAVQFAGAALILHVARL